MHLQKPDFLHSHCVLKKNNYCGVSNIFQIRYLFEKNAHMVIFHELFQRNKLISSFTDEDSEMNEIIQNVRLKRK